MKAGESVAGSKRGAAHDSGVGGGILPNSGLARQLAASGHGEAVELLA